MTIDPGASSNSIVMPSAPEAASPVCVGCLLKAIAEGRSLIKMEGVFAG